MKKIVFFNQFHNGDCFVSKGYVREIMRQLPDVEFEYAHDNHPDIIRDLNCKMIRISDIPALDRMTRVGQSKDGETIYINTWVGCWQGELFPHGQHINFIRLYRIWQRYFKHLNLEMNSDPNHYLPDIDFTKFDLVNTQAWMANRKQLKYVLICNGPANSGQSGITDDWSTVIDTLSTEMPDTGFVVTHKLALQKDNIYYTDDIIGLDSDLNQIAYLAHGALLIVGKNSGPFSYCQNKSTLLDPQKIFFNFSLLPTDCPSGAGAYLASCKFSNAVDPQRVTELIRFTILNPEYRSTELIT